MRLIGLKLSSLITKVFMLCILVLELRFAYIQISEKKEKSKRKRAKRAKRVKSNAMQRKRANNFLKQKSRRQQRN